MGVAMFNRKEKVDRTKLEHKLYLARATPELIFDLSHCDINKIPEGVYSLCRVLLKEKLDLSHNCLNSLKAGGDLKDLHLLQILDLGHNTFITIPDEMELLTNLLELYLNNNKIKRLPNSLCNLRKLKTLNLSNNCLVVLPENIDDMDALENLSLNGNANLSQLPKTTCKLSNLRDIKVDSSNFIYPPPDIIQQGAFHIKKYIADDTGYDCEVDEPTSKLPENVHDFEDGHQFKDTLQHFEEIKDLRTLKFLAAERDNEDLMKREIEIATALKSDKEELLKELIENENKFSRNLNEIHKTKEMERLKFIHQLNQAEEQANFTVDQLLLLKQQTAYPVTIDIPDSIQSPLTESKRDDILKEMQKLFEEESNKFQKYAEDRNETALNILKRESQIDGIIENILRNEDVRRSNFLTHLRENKDLQKAAVAILLQKGNNHSWTIIQEVKLIESHLANLTAVEINKRKNYIDEHITNLADTRIKLTTLLVNVLEQQELHRIHLLSMLQGMENENQTFDNYWLLQYHDILQKMQNVEISMDPVFLQTVLTANLFHYLPILAELLNGTDDASNISEKDLHRLGITNEVDQQKAVQVLRTYSHIRPEVSTSASPSAPYLEEASAPALHEADSYGDLNNTDTECIICMDNSSSIILIPCGHFCSCSGCSSSLQSCPLCRSIIEQRIQVYK